MGWYPLWILLFFIACVAFFYFFQSPVPAILFLLATVAFVQLRGARAPFAPQISNNKFSITNYQSRHVPGSLRALRAPLRPLCDSPCRPTTYSPQSSRFPSARKQHCHLPLCALRVSLRPLCYLPMPSLSPQSPAIRFLFASPFALFADLAFKPWPLGNLSFLCHLILVICHWIPSLKTLCAKTGSRRKANIDLPAEKTARTNCVLRSLTY